MKTSAAIYFKVLVAVALCVTVVACHSRKSKVDEAHYDDSWSSGKLVASWYGPDFHGKLTASGERYDMDAMTCAHKSLPFGTQLKITNPASGLTALVTVTDRGPFVDGRDIDLSRGAAKAIGIYGPGIGQIMAERVGRDEKYRKYLGVAARLGAGPYTVQVGAFAEIDNATHLLKSLELTHSDVHMTQIFINGKKLYRVRVGRYDTERATRTAATALADEGYSVMIVIYEPA